jgi:tetratricopeptide (TPR) repeat protein
MKIGLLLAFASFLPVMAQTAPENNKSTVAAPATADAAAADPLAPAQALLKQGKYLEAAAAFQVIVDKNPTSDRARTGLVRSLMRARKFDEAEDAAKKAVAAIPSSALLHATMGDVNFRLGKLAETEGEYRAALRLDANSARGWLGLGRVYDMVSMRKQAAAAFANAHRLDPEDRQIFEFWLDSLPRAQQLEELKKHAGANPDEDQARRIKYLTAATEKKPFELITPIKPMELKMAPYGRERAGVYDINRNGPVTVSKGFALQVKFNDRASADLLLDTGASGITIGNKLAEKAGVVKIVDSYFGGLGDRGPVQSYLGWVDKINIGGVEFRNYIVEVSSKKDIVDEAGLIGADVFSKFLITLDFRNQKLMLAPLPKNPAATSDDDEALEDRYIAPEMQGYTKFFHFSHDLVVPVVVSDKTVGNFILDTGADLNSISPKFAAQVTKASFQDDYRIKGVSGKIDRVATGDKVILMFAKMRIESHDLPVFSTDGVSAYEGTEIAGFIGIRTLVQMKMTIDYRDGLLNLEVYDFKKARE